jgi:hypothetical protein
MTGAVILLAALSLGPVVQQRAAAPQQGAAVPVSTPAAVVASHVRTALSNPDEAMNWAVLDASVQELEEDAAATEASTWATLWTGAGYWLNEVVAVVGTGVVFGLALIFTGLLTGGFVFRRLRSRTRPAEASAAATRLTQDISSGRAWTASVLSEQGMSDLEIARRTGMARDAVSLALKSQTRQLDPERRSVA